MYQGVIKDEARVAAKRQAQAAAAASTAQPVGPSGITIPATSLAARRAEYERNLRLQEELGREQGLKKSEEERRRLEQERELEKRKV
jgi:hypothetical protein